VFTDSDAVYFPCDRKRSVASYTQWRHLVELNGGCLCGEIRYSIRATPIDAGFCHCKICQKANAAPTVPWLTVPFGSFTYTKGRARAYASSGEHQREFCSNCGTQIVFRATVGPETVDVTLCSLDDSSTVEPEYHIWYENRVSWLNIDDTLPRFLDAGPDVEKPV